jgi:hypothetical protein
MSLEFPGFRVLFSKCFKVLDCTQLAFQKNCQLLDESSLNRLLVLFGEFPYFPFFYSFYFFGPQMRAKFSHKRYMETKYKGT